MTKKLVVGILAHVDAGKTTLSESLLYLSGMIRKQGRVDNGDSFLDTYSLERSRGITIFSKQAQLQINNTEITLLDTPGHVDFSAEMERTLQVLDYAILVINGADGVQSHTRTLWQLLERYNVPVFVWVNKMDQVTADQEAVMKQLTSVLGSGCIDFSHEHDEAFYEETAMCHERMLDMFLSEGIISDDIIAEHINRRHVFPCFYGSALKNIGIEEFMEAIDKYTIARKYQEQFAARVYKIGRDQMGNRLTYMKITGGFLTVRMTIEDIQEKVNQIRIYAGDKYETVNQAEAGTICAVTGLNETAPGQALGVKMEHNQPLLEPVVTYKIELPNETSPLVFLPMIKQLEEEVPELNVIWDNDNQEIHAAIMGEIQKEVIRDIVKQRFGTEISFGSGKILYKETISDTVEGVGHFEPLKHYAEVHLLMEPGKPGSGIVLATDCSTDDLDKNWQRLIMTHIGEKEHRGVLTGAPVTDMKITLVGGRAHTKHTEGGDFRQATYRAVRQGLMQAHSVLLEPYYDYRIEVPAANVGKIMNDLERLGVSVPTPDTEADMAVLIGHAPVSVLSSYQADFTSITRGHGKMLCTLCGYEPCHNAEEVIMESGYDPDTDMDNPTGSVFCSQGSGYYVSWDKVCNYMHIPFRKTTDSIATTDRVKRSTYEELDIGSDEIDAIIARTFYSNRKKDNEGRNGFVSRSPDMYKPQEYTPVKKVNKDKYLLVDGYNLIFAWEELKKLAEVNLDGARGKLEDILCNYQAIKGVNLILVFDAYRVQGHETELMEYHNIHVVYTREAETADQYIEKFAHNNGNKYDVTVATSDGLEQIIIRGQGCNLISSREFIKEIAETCTRVQAEYRENRSDERSYLGSIMQDITID